MGSDCKNCGNELTSVCMQCHACMGCKDPTSQAERISALESTERELREAVNVLATDLRSYIEDQAVGDWRQNISEEVLDNPIASAAVMEAAK